VIADLGSAGRRRLSVVGDAVNVASRLQDVARARATPILASADVVAVGGGAPDFRPLAAARLPGRDEAIEVLALGRSPSA
jgi:class 3 adenylate cyclase